MPRKRRKKSRYKRGSHLSPKLTNGPAKYRSGWELAYMQYLDTDDSVLAYSYEPFHIEYVSNIKSGKIRKYFPDLLVIKSDLVELIEIKPSNKLSKLVVRKKIAAAEIYAPTHNMKFIVITEIELKKLKLIK